MSSVPNAVLTTLMALAASLLGISLFVQVVQELYKYLTSSKSKAYSRVVLDFFGPAAEQVLKPAVSWRLMIRGPFQFRRRQPKGRLLPLDKDALVGAIERTAPAWPRLTKVALETEAKLQNGAPRAPSGTFNEYLNELARGIQEQPGKFDAQEIARFLADRGITVHKTDRPEQSTEFSSAPLDAASLLTEFRMKYLREAVRAEKDFKQFMQNYEYAYARRNLRQTFVIALSIALWCDFAFDALYTRAATATAREARSAAQAAVAAYEMQAGSARAATPAPGSNSETQSSISYLPQPRLRNILTFTHPKKSAREFAVESFSYLFGCMLTAVLVCFGAPFWNGVTKSLLRASQRNDPTEPKLEKTE